MQKRKQGVACICGSDTRLIAYTQPMLIELSWGVLERVRKWERKRTRGEEAQGKKERKERERNMQRKYGRLFPRWLRQDHPSHMLSLCDLTVLTLYDGACFLPLHLGGYVTPGEMMLCYSFKVIQLPWLVWLSGLSTGLGTERWLVWFPVRAHAWVVGQVPGWGRARGNQWMFLSLSFSLPSPFFQIK